MSTAISNDRGLLALHGAPRPQTQDLGVAGANRHGLQLGDGAEPSFQQEAMQGVSPSAAAAAAGQEASRPLPSPAVAADAMYLQLQPAAPAAAIPANQPHTSSHDSAGTGHTFNKGAADPKQQQQAAGYGHFVPRKDSNDNIPCFVQTSALFTNMCGYCGTRSTSGCWRRGWEIGPNRFINLCNKCGLRHKAGKLASVPEPPPPQQRGRAAAAATAGTSRPFSPHAQMQHSASAADLVNQLLSAAAGDDNPDSPHFSSGHAQAAASDPTGGSAAHHRQQQQQQQQQQHPTSSSGRRRRQQKPLTPKWSRVGGAGGGGVSGGSAGFEPEDPHMFAQMLAAGAFGGGGDSAGDMEGYGGGLLSPQHQHQQQLAMLLQSLGGGAAPASPSQHGTYSQAAAGHQVSSPRHQLPASSRHHTDGHNSNLSLSHYAAAGQQHASAAAAAAAASPATTGVGAGGMDSAQAVAAVLAAAAATAAASSDSRGTLPTSHSPLKLSKLSIVSVNTSALDNSSSQISSPAAKKRRTKKEATEGDAAAGGQGGEAAMAAQDAAAAGDAADALLALRSSAKPESPSWARLQQLATPSSMPSASPAGAFGSLSMPGPNMHMHMSRQVTSPSVDTSGGAKPGPVPRQYSPTLLQTASNPTAQAPLPQQSHPGPSALRPHASHLQPLTTQRLPAHQMAAPQQAAHAPSWSPEQIHAWLVQVGCAEVAAAFQAQGVDGQALSGLMRVVSDAGAARLDSQLKAEFGVEGVGVRLRLVDRLMRELAGLAGMYGGQL